jgi:hypothetical protein
MRFFRDTCIVGRNDNVLVVDFTRRPEPPAPRFPGANALRENATEEGELRVASLRR